MDHLSDQHESPSAGHGHSHGHGHGHGGQDAEQGLAEILDLDAELFAPHLAAVLDRVAGVADGGVRRIADVGAGTGAGTFALLKRFPGAHVTAVDTSPGMLAQIAEKARDTGLAERVATREADASAGLPGVEGADLVWASASLHHVGDPDAALAGFAQALRPGGLLTVAELDGMPRFLDDAALDGLESRCRTALDAVHAADVPHLGADWTARLETAGFAVLDDRTEDLELRQPLPPSAVRYALLALDRIRHALTGRVDAADHAALGALVDGGLRRRPELLVIRSIRRTWIARRP